MEVVHVATKLNVERRIIHRSIRSIACLFHSLLIHRKWLILLVQACYFELN